MNTTTRQILTATSILLLLAAIGSAVAPGFSHAVVAKTDQEKTSQRGFEVAVELRKRQLFNQVVSSHAQVLPHQVSLLNPIITGMVVDIKPEFEAGQAVRKGQVLAELDKTDFRYNLAKAQQSLAGAKLKLLEQQALSDRAIAEWQSRNSGRPSGLVAREPQLQAAHAELESASLLVEQATRDLAATAIRSPFDGWVVKRNASVGNFVNPSVSLAELIPSDKVIVRIALSSEQINHILGNGGGENSRVELFSSDRAATKSAVFTGLSLGSIVQDKTGQIFAEGIIELKQQDKKLLRPGAFLTAKIHTQQQGKYFAVPQAAVNSQGNIFVLNNGVTQELPIKTIFSRDENLIVEIPNTDEIHLVSSGVKQIWNGMPAYASNKHHE